MKYKTLASLALSAGLLAGCATHQPYTKTEKALLAATLLGATADIATTLKATDHNFEEANPFYGKNPSLEALITGKLLSLGAVYCLGELSPKFRKYFWSIGLGINAGAAIFNDYQMKQE